MSSKGKDFLYVFNLIMVIFMEILNFERLGL